MLCHQSLRDNELKRATINEVNSIFGINKLKVSNMYIVIFVIVKCEIFHENFVFEHILDNF